MCDCGCKEYFEEDRPKPAPVIPIVHQEEPRAFRPVILSAPEQSASHPYPAWNALGIMPENIPVLPPAVFSPSARSRAHFSWTASPVQIPPIQLQPLTPLTSIPGPVLFVQSGSPLPAPLLQVPRPAFLPVAPAPTPSAFGPGGYGAYYPYGSLAPNTHQGNNPLRRNAMGVLGD